MIVPDWLLSSAVATATIALIGFLGRSWLSEWVSAVVRHDFEKKLEAVRSELRIKEAQITALREGALANMVALQAANAQRRLKAADDLWQAVTEWNSLIGAVSQMSVIDFERASERVPNDPKMQAFFEMASKAVPEDINNLGLSADAARPFLSDLAWALFAAYKMIFHVAAMKVHLLKSGLDGRKFVNVDAVDELMVKALPDHKDFITQWGHKGHHQLVDILRDRILDELRRTIDGKQQDAESVTRAADIWKLALNMQRKMDEGDVRRP